MTMLKSSNSSPTSSKNDLGDQFTRLFLNFEFSKDILSKEILSTAEALNIKQLNAQIHLKNLEMETLMESWDNSVRNQQEQINTLTKENEYLNQQLKTLSEAAVFLGQGVTTFNLTEQGQESFVNLRRKQQLTRDKVQQLNLKAEPQEKEQEPLSESAQSLTAIPHLVNLEQTTTKNCLVEHERSDNKENQGVISIKIGANMFDDPSLFLQWETLDQKSQYNLIESVKLRCDELESDNFKKSEIISTLEQNNLELLDGIYKLSEENQKLDVHIRRETNLFFLLYQRLKHLLHMELLSKVNSRHSLQSCKHQSYSQLSHSSNLVFKYKLLSLQQFYLFEAIPKLLISSSTQTIGLLQRKQQLSNSSSQRSKSLTTENYSEETDTSSYPKLSLKNLPSMSQTKPTKPLLLRRSIKHLECSTSSTETASVNGLPSSFVNASNHSTGSSNSSIANSLFVSSDNMRTTPLFTSRGLSQLKRFSRAQDDKPSPGCFEHISTSNVSTKSIASTNSHKTFFSPKVVNHVGALLTESIQKKRKVLLNRALHPLQLERTKQQLPSLYSFKLTQRNNPFPLHYDHDDISKHTPTSAHVYITPTASTKDNYQPFAHYAKHSSPTSLSQPFVSAQQLPLLRTPQYYKRKSDSDDSSSDPRVTFSDFLSSFRHFDHYNSHRYKTLLDKPSQKTYHDCHPSYSLHSWYHDSHTAHKLNTKPVSKTPFKKKLTQSTHSNPNEPCHSTKRRNLLTDAIDALGSNPFDKF